MMNLTFKMTPEEYYFGYKCSEKENKNKQKTIFISSYIAFMVLFIIFISVVFSCINSNF